MVLVVYNVIFDVGFMNVNYECYGLLKISQLVIDMFEFVRNFYFEYKCYGLGFLIKCFGVVLEYYYMVNYDVEVIGCLFFIFIKEVVEKYGVIDLVRFNIDLVSLDFYKKV